MRFLQWPKIRNTYDRAFIQKFIDAGVVQLDMGVHVTEKLHGANFQVGVLWDGSGDFDIRFGSRTHWLMPGENFYGYTDVVESDAIKAALSTFKEIAREHPGVVCRWYGELCGPKVQKGVDYGDKRTVYFFASVLGEEDFKFRNDLTYLPEHMLVPYIGAFPMEYATKELNIEFPTKLNPRENNIAEGVVITPNVPIRLGHDYFMLKRKNEKFKERVRLKVKNNEPIPEDVAVLLSYLTEERVDSYMSKVGEISSMEQIGEYIRGIMADILEDYGEKPSKAAKRAVGSRVGAMLRKRLMSA